MRLYCTLGPEIIHLLTEIAEKKGEVKAYFMNRLEPKNIEENKIDSVHSSIYLQERILSREDVWNIVNNLSVKAPQKKIQDVQNTMRLYKNLSRYNPLSQDSFKLAYRELAGKPDPAIPGHGDPRYRKDLIFLYYWSGFTGLSIPAEEMRKGMKELFHYLRHGQDPPLVKSCLCQYAIQFYQPFKRDNEKMSRFWQTRLLMEEHPIFEFIPWEKEILIDRKKYYSKLPGRELNPDCTRFVHYMLGIIHDALKSLLVSCRKSIRPMDRIRYFHTLGCLNFTRKDYMLVHKNISMATAYRDLELGVETGFFEKEGSYNQTSYSCYLL